MLCSQWLASVAITWADSDPFHGDGLIDLLPTGIDKSSALAWRAEHSGDDYAALSGPAFMTSS